MQLFGFAAGKTTTLRMLATVLQPTERTAKVAGHDIVNEARQVRQKIGFLSGDMGLYHRLTPRELLIFFTGDLPLPVRVFIIWLAVILWKRNSDAGALVLIIVLLS